MNAGAASGQRAPEPVVTPCFLRRWPTVVATHPAADLALLIELAARADRELAQRRGAR